jgi:hypothetical protein
MNIRRYLGLVALTSALALAALIPNLAHAAPGTRQAAPVTTRVATVNDGILMQVDCNEPGVLHLYQDVGFGGNEICFAGTGCVNLTDFPMTTLFGFTLQSWNDQVSSYESDLDVPVKFYENINRGGNSFLASGFGPAAADLPGDWNDRASTLCVGADYF